MSDDAGGARTGWMSRYRHGLQTAVGASAGPYGYTLTIWTSGAVLIHSDGLPSGAEALLFALGSVFSFALLGALAFRRGAVDPGGRPRHPVVWGSFHFLPVGAAIAAATLLGHALAGSELWLVAGLTVTFIYLALVGAQITLFSRSATEVLSAVRAEEREVRDDVEGLAGLDEGVPRPR